MLINEKRMFFPVLPINSTKTKCVVATFILFLFCTLSKRNISTSLSILFSANSNTLDLVKKAPDYTLLHYTNIYARVCMYVCANLDGPVRPGGQQPAPGRLVVDMHDGVLAVVERCCGRSPYKKHTKFKAFFL